MAGFPKRHEKRGEKARDPHPTGTPKAIKKEDIVKYLLKFHGNISRTAEAIGCTRRTIHRAVDADPEVKAARDEGREAFLDTLEESAEHEAIHNPQATALKIFMLKTRARQRGYEQDESKNNAHDIAKAAFDFVLNRSANPAES